MYRWIIIFILVFVVSAISSTTKAQISLPDIPGMNDPISITVSPIAPQPNQIVSVELKSSTVQLNASTITWKINGTNQPNFKNSPLISFQTGNIGTSQLVEATITTLDNKTYSKNILLSPASVDLLWEGQSTLPPFYKGKALVPVQGSVKVQAIPNFYSNGSIINPKNILFTWKNNDEIISGASGLGKDSLTYFSNKIAIRPLSISVTASTPDNKYTAVQSITIRPDNSKILLYQNSSLYGLLYNTTLSQSLNLTSKNFIIHSSPYFFSSDQLTYSWTINDQVINSQNNNQELLIQRPDNISGNSQVSVKINNPNALLQFNSFIMNISY